MIRRISERQMRRNEEKSAEYKKLLYLYMEIWHKRPHLSEVSHKSLGKEPLTIFFHHILPKRSYPEAMFDEKNIILLTFDEHTKIENDPVCFEEVNKRREKLKSKYE